MAKVSLLQLPSGSWRLRLRLRDQRDQYRFVTGSRDEAARAAAVWEEETAGRGLAPAKPTITFRAWLDMQLAKATHLEDRTRERYEGLLRSHLGPLGDRRLARITAMDGEVWQAQHIAAGLGAATVRACFHLLKAGLAEAYRLRVTTSHAWADVRPVRTRSAAATETALAVPHGRQLAAVPRAATGRVGELLRLALGTGARRGELLALTWDHVDLDAQSIRITQALALLRGTEIKVKGPKSKAGIRTIDLPADLVALLRTMRAAAAETALQRGERLGPQPVLPGPSGGWWNPTEATRACTKALGRAGLPGTLHGLRHAHATHLLRQPGVSPRDVQVRMGHGDIKVTIGTYGHAIPSEGRRMADVLNVAMAG